MREFWRWFWVGHFTWGEWLIRWVPVWIVLGVVSYLIGRHL